MPISMGILCERCRKVYFISPSRKSARVNYDRTRREFKVVCDPPCNSTNFFPEIYADAVLNITRGVGARSRGYPRMPTDEWDRKDEQALRRLESYMEPAVARTKSGARKEDFGADPLRSQGRKGERTVGQSMYRMFDATSILQLLLTAIMPRQMCC
jgi:hypothetical protein